MFKWLALLLFTLMQLIWRCPAVVLPLTCTITACPRFICLCVQLQARVSSHLTP